MPGLILSALCLLGYTPQAEPLRFEVSYPSSAYAGTFSGRVVVYLSQQGGEPRFGPNWFAPQPTYSAPFRNVRPGQAMVIRDENATGFPGRLSALAPGEYTVQAVVDRNLGGRTVGRSPGNLYSAPLKVTLDPKTSGTVRIVCDQVVPEPVFKDTATVKGVRLRSKLLSDFYGRPTFLQAAVQLPKEYATEPSRRFPIVYEIPGFGGTHWGLSGRDRESRPRGGEAFLHVVLDPSAPTGHTVFADSANNGPWGKALTTELIPHIERTFRAHGKPGARFVTGHSSGGWSSLWLQVTYPDFFGGVWSTSPDPVDFRDFQRIDIYKPGANMFRDEAGAPRPLARAGSRVLVLYKPFSDMERPIRGEQLGSFEAVFSPRGADGEPMGLWNRDTGAIDPKVAEAWRKYDIGHILRTRWRQLGPKLKGKLHIVMGNEDTFYLEGAVKLLQKDLQALGSDADVRILPGDHGSVMTAGVRASIDAQMAETYRRWLQSGQVSKFPAKKRVAGGQPHAPHGYLKTR